MNDMNPPESAARDYKQPLVVKVFGLGGGGCNAVEHMARAGVQGVSFYALNTDARALGSCSSALTLALGSRLTRGLGAGGDPEIGRAAAEEDIEQLRVLCANTDVVLITTGLGGGTGTGASPVLARIARESGALVLALATLPFDCEGPRRRTQALAGLDQLQEAADAVVCLPNQRVLGLIDENTSLVETFKITNDVFLQATRALWMLLTRTGLINVDFADLCAVVRGRSGPGRRSVLAMAEARGEQRSREVVDKLLQSPLLDSGTALADADAMLVSVVGGTDLTMAEVNRVLTQINRGCDPDRSRTHIILGAAVDPELADRISITVIATHESPESVAGDEPPSAAEPETAAASTERRPFPPEHPRDQFLQAQDSPRPNSRFVAPPPELTDEQKADALVRQIGGRPGLKGRSRMRQGLLPLEIVSKGRFEKSEPTIYQGEDLDVPTYIRRGMALN